MDETNNAVADKPEVSESVQPQKKKSHKGLIIGLSICGVLCLSWAIGSTRNVANKSDVQQILNGNVSNQSADGFSSWGESSSGGSSYSGGGNSYNGSSSSEHTTLGSTLGQVFDNMRSDSGDSSTSDDSLPPVNSSDFDASTALSHDVSMGLSSTDFEMASRNLDKYLSDAGFVVTTDNTSTVTVTSGGVTRSDRVIVGRIASDKLTTFLNALTSDANMKIVSRNISTQSVAPDYEGIDADLESLQSELERYKEQEENAKTDIDKERFKSVQESIQEQIDSLEDTRKDIDESVEHTDVYIELIEDVSYATGSTQQSVRALQNKFRALPDQMFVICGNIVLGLIYLLPWFGLAFAIWFVGRYVMKKTDTSNHGGDDK